MCPSLSKWKEIGGLKVWYYEMQVNMKKTEILFSYMTFMKSPVYLIESKANTFSIVSTV